MLQIRVPKFSVIVQQKLSVKKAAPATLYHLLHRLQDKILKSHQLVTIAIPIQTLYRALLILIRPSRLCLQHPWDTIKHTV